MTFQELCDKLETKIIDSYENGVSLEEAERLAGEFLAAQLRVSTELKKADLDARMKKAGTKSVKAKVYLDCAKSETKLTDAGKAATVDSNPEVLAEMELLDTAESDKDNLDRYYSIFREAHIHFRGISKGRFE